MPHPQAQCAQEQVLDHALYPLPRTLPLVRGQLLLRAPRQTEKGDARVLRYPQLTH